LGNDPADDQERLSAAVCRQRHDFGLTAIAQHDHLFDRCRAGGTISVAHLFMAGIIPALLLGLSLIILVLIIAQRPSFPKGEIVPLRQALRIALDAVWGMITVAISSSPRRRPERWRSSTRSLSPC